MEFTEIDVSSDRDAFRRMIAMTGQRGVPVIVVGTRAMVGWDREGFQELMRR